MTSLIREAMRLQTTLHCHTDIPMTVLNTAHVDIICKHLEMEEINGFKVVPLHLKRLTPTQHTLFMKAHSLRKDDPDKPAKRTLFIINVPPYINEEYLKYGLQIAGEIENIIIQKKVGPDDHPSEPYDKFCPKPACNGFKVAFIVFKSTKSLDRALQLDKICLYDAEGQTIIRTGLKKWMQEYIDSIENEEALQAEIDEYMEEFDKKERAAQLAEKAGTVDDEGWVTVTKRGPVAGFEKKESIINKLEAKMEKSQKQKELKNFYTFQIRESKMQHIVSLRKKFEEDKSKIERLKQSRRFNPFSK